MPVLGVAQGRNGRLIILGLCADDIGKLSTGLPITGSLEKVTGVKGLEIVIVLGATDEAIRETISQSILTETLPNDSTAEDLTKMLDEEARKLEEG